jgi:hypothetical protein
MPGTRRWLFANGINPAIHPPQTENDSPRQHGSCVLAMAVSPQLGVAKKANMVIVKAPPGETFGDILDVFQIVENDIIEKGLQGQAVVNLSNGCK